MFYLRSKSVELLVRDGVKGPMKTVGVKRFVPFSCLPQNLPEVGDADLEVREKVEQHQIDKSQNGNKSFAPKCNYGKHQPKKVVA